MKKQDETALCQNSSDNDAGDFLEKEIEKQWQAFLAGLASFPCSFQLQHQQMTDNACRKLLRTLQADVQSGFLTDLEWARCLNLLAYFRFLSGEVKEAVALTERVLSLEGEKQNLTALANMAAILWRSGSRSKAEDKVKELECLKVDPDFHYLVVKAKAEQAYSYNRFGPSFYPRSVELFASVISEGREPEVCVWKFGLALTKRRGNKFHNFGDLSADADEAVLMDVLRLFLDVISRSRCDQLRAICYAEVGIFLKEREGTKLENKFQSEAKLTALEACEKALELDPKRQHVSVLWKCASIYKRANMLGKACELFERSVEMRPNTTQCHLLGTVYKAIALEKARIKTFKDATSRKGIESSTSGSNVDVPRHTIKQESGDCVKNTCTLPKDVSKLSLTAEYDQHTAPKEDVQQSSCAAIQTSAAFQKSDDAKMGSSKDALVKSLKRLVISPYGEEVKLSRSEPYVQKTFDALQQSLEFSSENVPAIFDLALLHRDVGELEKALKWLNSIQFAKSKMRPFDKINAFEQAGLILKTMSEQLDRKPEERQRLREECESKLNMALRLCSTLCNRMPGLQHLIKDVWLAFPVLFKAVEESDRHPKDKLKEKAKLFHLIRDHRHSLTLLEEMANMAPEEAFRPDCLRMKIKNYVGEGHYDQALTFISMLKCTSQGAATEEIVNHRYILNVYIKAAQEALRRSSSELASCNASEFFREAFSDAFCNQCDSSFTTSSGSEDDCTSGDSDIYDVMLIHEDSTEEKAKALMIVMQQVYGLRVTRMDEDCMPGRFALDYKIRTMATCRKVVVLAGQKKVRREMRLLIEHASRRTGTITLLAEGDHVPKLLKSRPAMRFPAHLLARVDKIGGEDEVSDWIQEICSFFRFILEITE